jgi:molecular chaperone HtpG
MVAEKVEIIINHSKTNLLHTGLATKPRIHIRAIKTTRGTEIILHIAEDSLNFLEDKIKGT